MTTPANQIESPDLPSYTIPTLLAYTEQDVLDAAVANFQLRQPDWQEQEGSVEVTLLESAAIVTGQLVYAMNQLPQAVSDIVFSVMGIPRKQATPATGSVRVTLSSSSAGLKLLPVGTSFRLQLADGTDGEVVINQAVTVNPADSLTPVVPVTMVASGASANGTPAGTTVQLVQGLSFIETAQLATALAGGSDAEEDDDYYPRAAARLRRQTLAIVVPEQFRFAALDWPGVGRAQVFDKWDGAGTYDSTDLGHVTVAVANVQGQAVTPAVKAALASSLTATAISGITVHVVDPLAVAYPLNFQIYVMPGYDGTAVAAAVTAEINAWLNPATWPWGGKLYANDVVARAARVAGVLRVGTINGTGLNVIPNPQTLPALPPQVTVTVATS